MNPFVEANLIAAGISFCIIFFGGVIGGQRYGGTAGGIAHFFACLFLVPTVFAVANAIGAFQTNSMVLFGFFDGCVLLTLTISVPAFRAVIGR